MRCPLLTFAIIAAALPADAQVPSQADLIKGFVRSPQVRTAVLNTLSRDEPAALRMHCGVPTVQDVSGASIEQNPVFVREGAGMTFQSGALVVRLATTRCGMPAIRRVLLLRAPGSENVMTRTLAPGDFPGNLKLEMDTLRIVQPGVIAKARCSADAQAQVLDTRAVRPMTAQGGVERWVFWACGSAYIADVTYTPILRDGVVTGMNVTGSGYRQAESF